MVLITLSERTDVNKKTVLNSPLMLMFTKMEQNKNRSEPDSIPRPKPAIDPGQIYPTASNSVLSEQDERRAASSQANGLAKAQLRMSGNYINPSPPKSKEVNIVGVLIILSGAVSILLNHTVLGVVFNAVYIAVGSGILTRSAMARKIVIYASAIGLLMNIVSLFGTSIFLSGKASIGPILSTLFSIAVQLYVLSVLTWHKNEAEFH